MTLMNLETYMTANVLARKVDSKDIIPEVEKEAVIVTAHVSDSTDRVNLVDSALQTDIRDRIMNIHVPTHH